MTSHLDFKREHASLSLHWVKDEAFFSPVHNNQITHSGLLYLTLEGNLCPLIHLFRVIKKHDQTNILKFFDKFLQLLQFLSILIMFYNFFENLYLKFGHFSSFGQRPSQWQQQDNPRDLWHLRHHCDPTMKPAFAILAMFKYMKRYSCISQKFCVPFDLT